MKEAIERGCYGYIDRRKHNQLIKAILCALVVAFLVALGIFIFGTKLNIIMLPAMLMVIPFANFFVAFVGLAQYHTAPAERYEKLKAYEDSGLLLSDLVMVNEKGRRIHAEFAIVYRNGVVLFGEGGQQDLYKMEVPINDIMKRKGIPMRAKAYSDWDEFLERINGVEMPADDTERRRVELAKEAVISLCI